MGQALVQGGGNGVDVVGDKAHDLTVRCFVIERQRKFVDLGVDILSKNDKITAVPLPT